MPKQVTRHVLELVAAALLGAIVTIAAVGTGGGSEAAERPKLSIDPRSAEAVVSEAVDEAANYTPEVACPSRITGAKGTTFQCEALVGDRIVPIDVKVVSRLGFIRVLETAPLRRLAREQEIGEEAKVYAEGQREGEERESAEAECREETWEVKACLREVQLLYPDV